MSEFEEAADDVVSYSVIERSVSFDEAGPGERYHSTVARSERVSSESFFELPKYELVDGWEKNVRKHIFILSSSGKPIFTRYGDEQEMVTTFGLLQAVVSIVQDAGDCIRSIRAGKRKIVYMIKNELYFVAISSTCEPESVLGMQLEFMYDLILLILTAKVHAILADNASKDLRDLLGADTTRLMRAACGPDTLAPTSIAFDSVQCVPMEKGLRDDVLSQLQVTLDRSGAALGLLCVGDLLVGYALSPELPLVLSVSDVKLLLHFVGNTNSLRHHEQNWVPICLPKFNSQAFLQAYIADLRVFPSMPNAHGPFSANPDPSGKPESALSLVLISTSGDSNMFKDLHEGRLQLEASIIQTDLNRRLIRAMSEHKPLIAKYLASTMCLHFLFKYRPSLVDSSQSSFGSPIPLVPSQWIATELEFPMNSLDSFERIWTQYHRLGLCLRRGSSNPECTMLSLRDSVVTPIGSGSYSSAGAVIDQGNSVSGLTSLGASSSGGTNSPGVQSGTASNASGGNVRPKSIRNLLFPNQQSAAPAIEHNPKSEMDDTEINVMRLQPSSDHSLVYSMMSTGHVIVALATSESEFYGTFPGPLGPLDACGMANMLSRTIRADVASIFQSSLASL